jgi:hypothetical protein
MTFNTKGYDLVKLINPSNLRRRARDLSARGR